MTSWSFLIGALIGEINFVGAITGVVLCAIFGLYPMLFRKISQRSGAQGKCDENR